MTNRNASMTNLRIHVSAYIGGAELFLGYAAANH